METFFIDNTLTPQGKLLIIADAEHRLRAIDWVDHQERMMKLLQTYYGQHGFRLAEKKILAD